MWSCLDLELSPRSDFRFSLVRSLFPCYVVDELGDLEDGSAAEFVCIVGTILIDVIVIPTVKPHTESLRKRRRVTI